MRAFLSKRPIGHDLFGLCENPVPLKLVFFAKFVLEEEVAPLSYNLWLAAYDYSPVSVPVRVGWRLGATSGSS